VAIDLVQDVFAKYWDCLTKGMSISNDRAFIFTIARNRIIDWYRKRKTISLEGLAVNEDNEQIEEFFIVEDNAKGALEMDSEGRFLISKIRDLPATSQQALYLRYVEGMSPKEIGTILNIKENAVSVRIHRGLEELRKITGYELQ
jgi:RNA polymerase sigma-70 factor (ECF subfamily)